MTPRSLGAVLILGSCVVGLAFFTLVDAPISSIAAPTPEQAWVFCTVHYGRWVVYAALAAAIVAGVLISRGRSEAAT